MEDLSAVERSITLRLAPFTALLVRSVLKPLTAPAKSTVSSTRSDEQGRPVPGQKGPTLRSYMQGVFPKPVLWYENISIGCTRMTSSERSFCEP